MSKENKTRFVILGLLSHEPMTGYDIKKRIDSTLHYFWSASYGSIYPSLNELEKQELVTKHNQSVEGGRAKIVYEITELGREQLREWLSSPVEKDELRYETLLKLFFGKEAGYTRNLQLIEEFMKKYEKEIPVLQGAVGLLSGILEQDETHLYYMLSAMFGVKIFEAYVAWSKEATKMIKDWEEKHHE